MGQRKTETGQASQCSLEWLNDPSISLQAARQPVSWVFAPPPSGRDYAWHSLSKVSRCWASGHPQGSSRYLAPSLSLPGTQVQNVYFPLQGHLHARPVQKERKWWGPFSGAQAHKFSSCAQIKVPITARCRDYRTPTNLLPFCLCI